VLTFIQPHAKIDLHQTTTTFKGEVIMSESISTKTVIEKLSEKYFLTVKLASQYMDDDVTWSETQGTLKGIRGIATGLDILEQFQAAVRQLNKERYTPEELSDLETRWRARQTLKAAWQRKNKTK
jgi:hypothetical protein